MKQMKIEFVIATESFEDTFLDKVKSEENPGLIQDVITAFTWAFQIPTDGRSMAIRKLIIKEIEDDNIEENPAKYIPNTGSND